MQKNSEDKIFGLLQKLGLTEDEVQVYLSVFELRQSVVSPIASMANIQRTSCYHILDSLMQKNLVVKSNFRGKQSYSVADPNILIDFLKEEQKEIENKVDLAQKIQDELKTRYKRKYTKPMIRYVEGLDGIKELYEESLKCNDRKEGIFSYTSVRDIQEDLGNYADEYYSRRARRNIPIKALIPDTESGKEVKRKSKDFLREIRLIPHEKYDFSPEIYLYDNVLSVMSFKEGFGFMVESKEIVDALKTAWKLAWEGAGKYNEEGG